MNRIEMVWLESRRLNGALRWFDGASCKERQKRCISQSVVDWRGRRKVYCINVTMESKPTMALCIQAFGNVWPIGYSSAGNWCVRCSYRLNFMKIYCIQHSVFPSVMFVLQLDTVPIQGKEAISF